MLEAWQLPGQHFYFRFSHPTTATYSDGHHDYPAADIFAPAGTTVVAVTDGVVDELRRTDPGSRMRRPRYARPASSSAWFATTGPLLPRAPGIGGPGAQRR